MNDIALVNGEVVEDACISLDDRGVTLGDGLFETIALYGGTPYALTPHLARLRLSATALGFTLPFDDTTVAEGISLLAERKKIERGVVRLMMTRGVGPRGYSAAGSLSPNWFLTLNRYTPLPDHMRVKGIRVGVASLRKSGASPLATHKTISSLERVVQMAEATTMKSDENVTLTTEGDISSFVAGTIFWVGDGGRLYTPSTACAILPGIVRGEVIALAATMGIEVVEGEWPLDVLGSATEIFLTNSLLEIMPVRDVIGLCNVGPCGTVTRQLQEAYRSSVTAATP